MIPAALLMSLSHAPAQAPSAGELPSAARGATSYAVLPGRLIRGQTVSRVNVSPDGRWIALESDPEPEEALDAASSILQKPRTSSAPRSVLIIDAYSGASLGELVLADGQAWTMAWSSRRDRGLLATTRTTGGKAVHTVQAWSRADRLGQPLVLSEEQAGQVIDLYPSPVQPYMLALGQRVDFGPDGLPQNEEWRLMRISDDGKLAQAQTYARETSGPKGAFWNEEGRVVYFPVTRNAGPPGLARIVADSLELAVVSPSFASAPEAEPPFELVKGEAGWTVKGEGAPSSVLAPPQARLIMSQDCSRIAEVYQGALYVHDVVKLSLSDLAKASYTYARQAAEKKARDAGRALRFYWRDNFMHYPLQARAKELLSPYLRSLDSLEGLEIRFAGGPLERDVDTTATPYAWIRTRYGLAVIMLDGTVVWREGSGT